MALKNVQQLVKFKLKMTHFGTLLFKLSEAKTYHLQIVIQVFVHFGSFFYASRLRLREMTSSTWKLLPVFRALHDWAFRGLTLLHHAIVDLCASAQSIYHSS